MVMVSSTKLICRLSSDNVDLNLLLGSAGDKRAGWWYFLQSDADNKHVSTIGCL